MFTMTLLLAVKLVKPPHSRMTWPRSAPQMEYAFVQLLQHWGAMPLLGTVHDDTGACAVPPTPYKWQLSTPAIADIHCASCVLLYIDCADAIARSAALDTTSRRIAEFMGLFQLKKNGRGSSLSEG